QLAAKPDARGEQQADADAPDDKSLHDFLLIRLPREQLQSGIVPRSTLHDPLSAAERVLCNWNAGLFDRLTPTRQRLVPSRASSRSLRIPGLLLSYDRKPIAMPCATLKLKAFRPKTEATRLTTPLAIRAHIFTYLY